VRKEKWRVGSQRYCSGYLQFVEEMRGMESVCLKQSGVEDVQSQSYDLSREMQGQQLSFLSEPELEMVKGYV